MDQPQSEKILGDAAQGDPTLSWSFSPITSPPGSSCEDLERSLQKPSKESKTCPEPCPGTGPHLMQFWNIITAEEN